MDSFYVPPLKRIQIIRETEKIRRALHIPLDEPLEIVRVVEAIVGEKFQVLTHDEMGDRHGYTIPGTGEMYIRCDVYDNACEGFGRDRMTIGHEFGHWYLHDDIKLVLSRVQPGVTIKPYNDSEWQANAFGGALLMPAGAIARMTPAEISSVYQVSYQAAQVQKGAIEKLGLW